MTPSDDLEGADEPGTGGQGADATGEPEPADVLPEATGVEASSSPYAESEARRERRAEREARRPGRTGQPGASDAGGPDGRMPSTATAGRVAVALLVLLALGIGIGLDWANPAALVRPGTSGPPVQQAWFCPDTPSGPGGRESNTAIEVVSMEDRPLRGTVDIAVDQGDAPASVPLTVPAHGKAVVTVAEHTESGGAATVTLPAGRVAVGARVVRQPKGGKAGVAIYPCARRTSTRWYFALGTTARTQQEFLSIFNPTRDDAVVRIGFVTEQGSESPDVTRAVTVPAGRRQVVAVHDAVIRRNEVSALVSVVRGRVVASVALLPEGGARGLGTALGVAEAGSDWYLTGGSAKEPNTETLAVLNPSSALADIDLEADPDAGKPPVAPRKFELAPRKRANVDLTDIATAETSTGLHLEARAGDVAVMQSRGTKAMYSLLEPHGGAPERRWLVPWSPAQASDVTLEVQNPADGDMKAQVYYLGPKGSARLERLGEPIVVPGRSRASIGVASLKPAPGVAGFLVALDRPGIVSAGYVDVGDLAMSGAIPLQ